VSLINDALRKARQAASERDATQADLPFRGERIHSSRRGRQSTGAVVVVLVAVAAGLLGAAIAWWGFGRQPSPLEAAQANPPADAKPVGTEKPFSPPPIQPPADGLQETAIPLQPSPAATAEHSQPSGNPPPPPSPEIGTDVESDHATATLSPPEAEPVDAGGGARPETNGAAEGPVVASGDREFILDADLGYASLSLGYIVFRPADPFAEINGTEVHQGSEIEGFTVETIERDLVRLRDSRGPLVLRVP
jgi:hypothetical protein